MPQAWTMRTPCRSSNASISAARHRRAAARRSCGSDERSTGLLLGVAQDVVPDRRHRAARSSAAPSAIIAASGSACRKRPGMTRSAPTEPAPRTGRPHAFAWNIGTIGRTRSRVGERERARRRRCDRVQVRRAVRVDDALRVAGRAARVAHGRGARVRRSSGHSKPGCSAREQVLVAQHLRVGGLASARGVAVADDDERARPSRARRRPWRAAAISESSTMTTWSSAWLTT